MDMPRFSGLGADYIAKRCHPGVQCYEHMYDEVSFEIIVPVVAVAAPPKRIITCQDCGAQVVAHNSRTVRCRSCQDEHNCSH
jgi:hypothetical protein